MNRQEELIQSLKMDIEQLYMHEDDAEWYANKNREGDFSEYTEEQLESCEQEEQNAAYQLLHIIDCDLTELSEIMGQKVTIEDFTEGGIYS